MSYNFRYSVHFQAIIFSTCENRCIAYSISYVEEYVDDLLPLTHSRLGVDSHSQLSQPPLSIQDV